MDGLLMLWKSLFVVLATTSVLWSHIIPAIRAMSPPGFLYIDCGASAPSTDRITSLDWFTDDNFITTETNFQNVPNAAVSYPDRIEYKSLRYFNDSHPKNCYSLPVKANTTYLLRADFYYGGYDNGVTPPTFQMAIDATVVTNINTSLNTEYSYEYTLLTQGNMTFLCLLRDSSNSVPFISAIALRQRTPYPHMETQLVLNKYVRTRNRLSFGTNTTLTRYPDDSSDRFWWGEGVNPNHISTTTPPVYYWPNTSQSVSESNFDDPYLVPMLVFQSGVATSGNMTLLLNPQNTILAFLMLYFAELSPSVNSKHTRRMRIHVPTFNLDTNESAYEKTGAAFVGGYWSFYSFSYSSTNPIYLYPDPTSSYGPLLNALEFFEIQDPGFFKTNGQDATAIDAIKYDMGSLAEWTGDPCLPLPHPWISCEVSTTVPQILTLNLSGYQLNTTISPNFAKLTSLTSLSLDGCGLIGTIPDLSTLKNLKYLHLQNNMLVGALPQWLTSLTGLTELFVENNQFNGSIPDKLLFENSLNFRYKPGNPLLGVQISNSPSPRPSSSMKFRTIIGSIIGGVTAIALIGSLVIYFLHMQGQSNSKSIQGASECPVPLEATTKNPCSGGARVFSFSEIVAATQNFTKEIGKGGFGTVYYGKLDNGQELAVKVLNIKSCQGSCEFFNEVEILSLARHKNVVSLVGYCNEQDKYMIIYDYVHRGSLRDHLSGESGDCKVLDWKTRLTIALNAAQGLEYLHTGCNQSLIHRDVKPSNILLTAKMESAKLCDFGLSRLIHEEDGSYVSTLVKGTACYVDPEYFSTHHLSKKSDVYGFGVVLLELITGRCPVNMTCLDHNESSLLTWVRSTLEAGDIDRILHHVVRASRPSLDALWKVTEIAMRSVEPQGINRPSMREVVDELRRALDLEETSRVHSPGTTTSTSIYCDELTPI